MKPLKVKVEMLNLQIVLINTETVQHWLKDAASIDNSKMDSSTQMHVVQLVPGLMTKVNAMMNQLTVLIHIATVINLLMLMITNVRDKK